jgi:hypothetical protein
MARVPRGKREAEPGAKTDRRRVLGALLGVSAIFALLLVPVGWKFEDPWAAGLWNLLHLPGFFLLTRFLSGILAGCRDRAGLALASPLLALAAGIVTELLQARLGRSASVHDFVLDGFGVLLAVTWPARSGRWSAPRGIASALTLLGGIAFAFAPAWNQELIRREARAHLPVIGAFSEARLRCLWVPQGRTTAEWDAGTAALRVRMNAGTFGGINYRAGLQDWSGYRELVLTSRNPGPRLRLGVRIDDVNSAADRGWLSDEAWLETGLSEVRIPLHRVPEPGDKRAIDWTRIGRLVLFVDKSEIPVEFSLQSAVLR